MLTRSQTKCKYCSVNVVEEFSKHKCPKHWWRCRICGEHAYRSIDEVTLHEKDCTVISYISPPKLCDKITYHHVDGRVQSVIAHVSINSYI